MTDSSNLLLLETSAIVDTDPNTWKAIAKLGRCFLPEVVAIEIKNIANGKTDGNEASAKQFQHLLTNLNWQITPLTAKHPELLIRSTQNLSRKAKLNINTAQSAVGLANAHPQQCVVLIADEISLRDRIAKLDHHNLCAIPSAIARQWSRTDHAPPVVEKLIKKLQTQTDQTFIQPQENLTNRAADQAVASPKPAQSPPNHIAKPSSKNGQRYQHIVINFLKFGLTTTFLATICLLGWRSVQPQQFQQFWEKTGLPYLPQLLPDVKQPKKST